jgi:hypothetical protein
VVPGHGARGVQPQPGAVCAGEDFFIIIIIIIIIIIFTLPAQAGQWAA